MTVETSGQNWEESTDELDVEELVLRAQEGEEDALDELMKFTYSEVIKKARNFCNGNPHEAEDLAQEVCIRVLRSLDGYHANNFRAWLTVVAKHLFYDYLRTKQRNKTSPVEDEILSLVPAQNTVHDPVHSLESEREIMEMVEKAIGKEWYEARFGREIIYLYMMGFSDQEIRDMIGVQWSTIRSRRNRIRGAIASEANREHVEKLFAGQKATDL